VVLQRYGILFTLYNEHKTLILANGKR